MKEQSPALQAEEKRQELLDEGGTAMLDAERNRRSAGASGAADGVKVVGVYLALVGMLLVQGGLYRTSLSTGLLASLNLVVPLLGMALILLMLRCFHENAGSMGITSENWGTSVLLGAVLAVLLLAGMAVYSVFGAHKSLQISGTTGFGVLIFIAGAVHEELAFRGYIEHHLETVIRNIPVCSILTAGLFLLIHYPIFWALEGRVTFVELSAVRAADILVLHFLCDFTARKTRCLWGAMVLHFLYNMGVSVFIFV